MKNISHFLSYFVSIGLLISLTSCLSDTIYHDIQKEKDQQENRVNKGALSVDHTKIFVNAGGSDVLHVYLFGSKNVKVPVPVNLSITGDKGITIDPDKCFITTELDCEVNINAAEVADHQLSPQAKIKVSAEGYNSQVVEVFII